MSARQQQRHSAASHEAGFTLLELLLALLIGGLAIVALQPLFARSGGDRALEAALREVAGELRLARLAAIRGNREEVVRVDLAERAIVVASGGARRPLPRGIEIDTTVATTNAAGGSATFRFYPDGSSSGGSIRLRRGQASGRLVLDWLSGHVRTEDGSTL